jgi:hypothetical protein
VWGNQLALNAFVCWAWNFGGHQLIAKIGGTVGDAASSPTQCVVLIGRTRTAAGCGRMYKLRITVILHACVDLWRPMMTYSSLLPCLVRWAYRICAFKVKYQLSAQPIPRISLDLSQSLRMFCILPATKPLRMSSIYISTMTLFCIYEGRGSTRTRSRTAISLISYLQRTSTTCLRRTSQ